ncbi:uncharacterized protein LOC101858826 [Aplysia californica]|uniref:Uncharacterized protein LOC101858826 n=1 Tax=Aplysia californica TaxID=6500 RepID=A0ABM0KA12_APLCA|nr:uncharacterized protein LOC101858826 [Aplysia californica]
MTTKTVSGDSYGNLHSEGNAFQVDGGVVVDSPQQQRSENLPQINIPIEIKVEEESEVDAGHESGSDRQEEEMSSQAAEHVVGDIVEDGGEVSLQDLPVDEKPAEGEIITEVITENILHHENNRDQFENTDGEDKDQNNANNESNSIDDENHEDKVEDQNGNKTFEVKKVRSEPLMIHLGNDEEDDDDGDCFSGEGNGDNDDGMAGEDDDDEDDADSGMSFVEDDRSFEPDINTGRTSAQSRNRPPTTSTLREVPHGLRAKANTPASVYTIANEVESPVGDKRQDSGRAGSRGSREEVFQRAMTLMSNRCTSAREQDGVLFSARDTPYGVHVPQYFYVTQKRPAAMPPLKVWRGYKGNVYFEPLTIHQVKNSLGNKSADLEPRGSVSMSVSPSKTVTPRVPTRATTAGGSSKSYRLINSSPQVYVMDKQAVVGSLGEGIQRELRYIEGLESTGSLAMRPMSSGATFHRAGPTSRRMLYKRDRICRGSNFHVGENACPRGGAGGTGVGGGGSTDAISRRSSYASSRFTNRKQYSQSAGPVSRPHHASRSRPPPHNGAQELVVSGDKFAPPTVMSPLLRTTTQFSLSHQRSPIDSPDLLREYEQLPPMEQVSVSLRHMDIQEGRDDLESRPSSYTEELKPFIKYSPDVKGSYERNVVNTC